MKNIVINNTMNFITQYKQYDNTTLEEMRYGLASIYLTFSKLIIISIIAIIMGIFKEVLILIVIYNIIRSMSFGLHATKSWICLLSSSIIFIGGTILCMNIELNKLIIMIIGLLSTILIFIYSPADTKKRPIVSLNRRRVYKYISTIIAITYIVISITINNSFITNCMVLSLLIQSIVINPLIYKLFKMTYNNYKNFKMN